MKYLPSRPGMLLRTIRLSFLVATFFLSTLATAQDDVFVFRDNGRTTKISGKVTDFAPGMVMIDEGNKTTEIPETSIKKIEFGGEPSALGRARDRMDDGRYADCLEELGKIEEAPSSPFIQHEIDYLNAYCNAQIALRGGDVTANVAGGAINSFVRNYAKSYKFYDATELLGRLLMAIGKPDLAEKEFAKLAQSADPQDQINGYFYQGQAMLLQDNIAGAKTSFSSIGTVDSVDDYAQQYKLVAQCQLARIKALEGDPEGGIADIEAIIKKESPDNKLVFAYAYNARGECYLKQGKTKDAAIAFLFTELLCSLQPEPHAEALFRLAQLWPELEELDRANRARSIIKTRYRNSYWATKL